MVKIVLLIIFILLWKFNANICTYFYPYVDGLGCDAENWKNWYLLRASIYEWMFLIAVVSQLFKRTVLSNAISIFGMVYISCSVIDKSFGGIFNETLRDWMVVLPASVFCAYMYIKYRSNVII